MSTTKDEPHDTQGTVGESQTSISSPTSPPKRDMDNEHEECVVKKARTEAGSLTEADLIPDRLRSTTPELDTNALIIEPIAIQENSSAMPIANSHDSANLPKPKSPNNNISQSVNSPTLSSQGESERIISSAKSNIGSEYNTKPAFINHDGLVKRETASDLPRSAEPFNSKIPNSFLSFPAKDRPDQSSIVRAIAENSATIANLERGLGPHGLRATAMSASPDGLSLSLPIPTLTSGPSTSLRTDSGPTLNLVSEIASGNGSLNLMLSSAGPLHNEQSVPTKKPDRLVLIYDKPRYYHTIMQLNELRNNPDEIVRILELVNSDSIISDPALKKTCFDYMNICIEYTKEFHSYLQKFIKFLETHAAKLGAIPQVSFHFHLSPDRKWPSGYTQDERDSYTKFAETLSKVAGNNVVQCSIINKYDMDTVYITDPKELAKIGEEIQRDISPWKNLKILDYGESSIRFLPDIQLPPTLEVLNIGGGYALETLVGFKMPPRLHTLLASQGAILSIDNIVFPPTLKRLELSDNRIYFVTYADFPQSLEHLDLSLNRIESLRGVNFPRNLKSLDLGFNPIESFKGVRFPESLEALDLSDLPNESMSGVKFPDLLTTLNLQGSMTSTRGLKLPPNLVNLTLCGCGVNSINPLKLPNTIEVLYLNDNNIKTLNKVNFPPRLREIYLGDNLITTLKNVIFPPTLQVLDFDMNPDGEDTEKYISTLKDVLLPPGLRVLKFNMHAFKSVESFDFPPSLVTLSFANNGLRSIRDVRFGNNLKTLDLSGNPQLYNIDQLILPDSVTELRIPQELETNLPAYIVERANRKQLVLAKCALIKNPL